MVDGHTQYLFEKRKKIWKYTSEVGVVGGGITNILLVRVGGKYSARLSADLNGLAHLIGRYFNLFFNKIQYNRQVRWHV